MSELVCWNCGESLQDVPRPISRHATCSHCFNELHCCRLCRHFDAKRNMQCFEERADPPLQKENANFCDFFSPRANAFQAQTRSRSEAAKSNLDSLFSHTEMPQEAPQEALQESATAASADAADNPADAETNAAEQPTLSKDELARRKLDDLFS